MTDKSDDLEAVRKIVASLESFDTADRERIIRWAREKLGLPVPVVTSHPGSSQSPTPEDHPQVPKMRGGGKDIKTFVAEKQPPRDNDFAATVAYYYRFEAPDFARKDSITAVDLQEACRLSGRSRFTRSAQTLINAQNAGFLDKAGDRGAYAISTVGENLVAMTLPSESPANLQAGGASKAARGTKKSKGRSAKRRAKKERKK